MVKIHEFHDRDNALCIDRENTLEAFPFSIEPLPPYNGPQARQTTDLAN
jgi:hypothetical protein